MRLPLSIKVLIAASALLLNPGAVRADTITELIKKGDILDQKLQGSDALKFYLAAEKSQPASAQLLVSISRQYRHMATDAAAPAEKLRLNKLALTYAQRAAQLAPSDAEAQLAVAICYGKLLPLQGAKEQTEATPRIKAAAEKAIRLDPQSDLAWHVLGRWHEVLANVSGVKRALGSLLYGTIPSTTNEAAVKCFEKAIALNPNRLRHYVELGRTYAQMGRAADARRFIEKGLAMPSLEKDDAETKQRGRESLAKIL